jgi:hypothetical protein
MSLVPSNISYHHSFLCSSSFFVSPFFPSTTPFPSQFLRLILYSYSLCSFIDLYFPYPVRSFSSDLSFPFLWRCDPTRVMASSFLRFLDHTQRRTTVGRTPLDK